MGSFRPLRLPGGNQRHRVSCRYSRLRRRHPGAERRRLRPGGRGNHRRRFARSTLRQWPLSTFREASAASPIEVASSTRPIAVATSSPRSPSASTSPQRPHLTYADLTRHFGDAQPTPIEVYHAVREIRHGKGMLIVAGRTRLPQRRAPSSRTRSPSRNSRSHRRLFSDLSADKIPHWSAAEGQIKLPAAWLLERAGFVKGYTMGNAGISSRHTLALINRGNATAADILRSARHDPEPK